MASYTVGSSTHKRQQNASGYGNKTATGEKAPVGTLMADGTIYAGISPKTKGPMYIVPADASLSMSFNSAAKYAKNLEFGGNNDFHLPSKEELDVIYKNKDLGALKGSFNETGKYPAGGYWTSSQHYSGTWKQNFATGEKDKVYETYGRNIMGAVRCVRTPK